MDRASWVPVLRWVRSRPWPVWAAAGAVFVLFAVLGAITRTPAAMTSAARGPGLAEGLEQGLGGASSAPAAPAPPAGTRYPGVSYPERTPALPDPASPTPSASVAFANCAEAEAAGAAPIRRGRPGYRPALDRDGDGIACDAPDPGPTATPSAPGTPTPGPTPEPTVSPTPTASPSPTVAPTSEPPVVDPGTG